MTPKPSTSKTDSLNTEYAIVETSGSQFWLETDRYYDLDRIHADIDQTISLDKVLLVNDGKKIKLGDPYIKGASVELKVMAHRRGPKILVYKMRPKKKTRKKSGHRQELTRVMVESISIKTKSNPKKATKSIKDSVTSTKKTTSPTKKAIKASKEQKEVN